MSIENTKLNKINQQAIFFTKTTDKLHIDKEMCQFWNKVASKHIIEIMYSIEAVKTEVFLSSLNEWSP